MKILLVEPSLGGFRDHLRCCDWCNRVYRRSQAVSVGGVPMCPYQGCDGHLEDSWGWFDVLRVHGDYPKKPVPGVVYEL